MKNFLHFSFFLCFLYSINSILCDNFKCPERGKVGKLKVPNVLSLIDKQNGYHASVEVINPTRNNLVHDYYDLQNKVGFIDLEAFIQSKIYRRYYYHSTGEKIAVREGICKRLELTQNEKIESIKDWFELKDIVASSEMFKDLVHLGPTGLMIYANSKSDKASFIGSELIEGRTVNHWFYCSNPNGPYIDFYFDVKTSLPYRFSLYYPKWIETQEAISINETQTVKKQVDSDSKYVYNFYMFKPLVISSDDPIPYPLGYGCARKGTRPSTPLPNFSQVNNFNLDMEAIITYPHHDPIKSTARVMKRGDVISYEIQENGTSVRFIELPPPLGRFQVDEHTGQCSHSTTAYPFDVTLVTRWPSDKNQVFNLFYYLLMKPPKDQALTFIGDIPLGPFRVEEYKATNFFRNGIAAIIDYYYTQNTSNSVPSKVIFTEDPSDYYSYETQVEVTIINYKEVYIDYEDRFDVSGCYEEPGSYTWFQLLFSNPSLSEFNLEAIRQSTEEYLTSFIPVTRIGEIHAQQVDFNVYVTVKLYDRVNLIKGYLLHNTYKINNPAYIVKRFKVEDCEQLCSATEKCFDFSYCDDYDCSIYQSTRSSQYSTSFHYTEGCISYSRSKYQFDLIPLVNKNYLSAISHVLQQIRNKVSSGNFRLLGLSAEDLFIVNGPEEIGDISQELHRRGSFKPLRGEDFPIIRTDRHFNEGQFKIEKSTLNECFIACLNDDDCNTLSYCVNQNKECILSGETSSSLNDTFEDKTSHADGCDIYQKSFINLFHEYPGKNLVLDAVSTIPDVPIGDCASTCAQSESFNCESFDYCENNNNRNQSICLLHVNHIVIDKTREINITNWKFAEAGCSHYSKKSELDYEHKVGLALKDDMKESIVATFDHLSLEHCASKCNSDPNCFTLEFCETIDYNQISGRSASLSSCTLTNLKPSNIQPHLFEESKSKTKICSIYINHKKITGKSEADPPIQTNTTESLTKTSTKSNDFSLAIGLGTIAFILAFAAGFTGFKFTPKEGFVKKAKLKMTVPMKPTRETK
uniref:Apple domain-containing protein n=1 Tax=Tetranychus urticae TaxID=32264 RepID=A0A158P574_TETUR